MLVQMHRKDLDQVPDLALATSQLKGLEAQPTDPAQATILMREVGKAVVNVAEKEPEEVAEVVEVVEVVAEAEEVVAEEVVEAEAEAQAPVNVLTMTSSMLKKLCLMLFVCALFVIGWQMYEQVHFVPMKPSTSDQLSQLYSSALESHQAGDFTQTIQKLQQALSETTDPAVAARAKEVLAINLFARNEGGDRMQAMQLYKEIISDNALASSTRAFALADLALLVSNQNASFMQDQFSASPYSFYPSTSMSSTTAVCYTLLAMLRGSDDIFPNSLAEYAMAYTYTGLINTNPGETQTNKQTATLMQHYIAEGDSHVDAVQYLPSNRARMYLFRAIALGSSGNILGTPSISDREAAYKEALAVSQNNTPATPDVQLQAVSMQVRFFYANFLLKYIGMSRVDDIRVLLQPYAQAVSDPQHYQLTRGDFFSPSNYVRGRAVQLAAVSPDFKDFLLSLGWKL